MYQSHLNALQSIQSRPKIVKELKIPTQRHKPSLFKIQSHREREIKRENEKLVQKILTGPGAVNTNMTPLGMTGRRSKAHRRSFQDSCLAGKLTVSVLQRRPVSPYSKRRSMSVRASRSKADSPGRKSNRSTMSLASDQKKNHILKAYDTKIQESFIVPMKKSRLVNVGQITEPNLKPQTYNTRRQQEQRFEENLHLIKKICHAKPSINHMEFMKHQMDTMRMKRTHSNGSNKFFMLQAARSRELIEFAGIKRNRNSGIRQFHKVTSGELSKRRSSSHFYQTMPNFGSQCTTSRRDTRSNKYSTSNFQSKPKHKKKSKKQ